MKSIHVPIPVPCPSFYIVKALASLLDSQLLETGRRNFIKIFALSGMEDFKRSPRYPTRTKVRQDCIAFALLFEKEFTDFCLSVGGVEHLDEGSRFFLDIMVRTMNWPIQFNIDNENSLKAYAVLTERDQRIFEMAHPSSAPFDFEAVIRLAHDSNMVGDHFTAIRLIKKLLKSSWTNSENRDECLALLVKCHHNLEDLDSARFYSDVALTYFQSPRRLAMLHYERAMMSARMGLDAGPRHSPASELDLAFRNLNAADATSDFNCESDRWITRSVLENGLALLHIQRRDLDGCMAAMERSTCAIEQIKEIDPQLFRLMLPVALSNKARCEMQRGNLDRAADLQAEALRLEPDYVDNYVHMVRIESMRENFQRVENLCRKAIELHPGDPELYLLLSKVVDDPEYHLKTAVRISGGTPEGQVFAFNLASWLHGANRWIAAENAATPIIQDPTNPHLFENAASLIADVKFHTQGPTEALQFLQSLLSAGIHSSLISENIDSLSRVRAL